MGVEGTFDLDFVLFASLLLLLLLGLEQFQIILSVLLVSLGDQSASRDKYSLGVFTFPSTTTTCPSISDWEVLVPLMGPFRSPNFFLLREGGGYLMLEATPDFEFLFLVEPALREEECSDCIRMQ